MIDLKLKFFDNIYLVGGGVRDSLLNREIKDLDFVCKCNEKDFKNIAYKFFKINFNIKPFLIGKTFPQTYRGIYKKKEIDLTILENDFEFDAKRRDFTINSIYFDFKNKKIIDPLNGIKDIERKIIKVSSETSLKNDPLRILRAFRLFSQLKDFKIESQSLKKIKLEKDLLKDVAKERIKEEIDKIILSDKRYLTFKILKNFQVLEVIFPEIYWENLFLLKKMPQDLSDFEKRIFTYSLLFKKNILTLKPSNQEKKIVNAITDNYEKFLKIKDDIEIMKFIFKNRDYIDFIFNFCKTFFQIECLNKKERFYNDFLKKKEVIFNYINGNDLINLGIKQGKIIGEILEELRFLYYKGDITSKDEALNHVKKNFFD